MKTAATLSRIRFLGSLATVALTALALAASASADFEQVGNFAQSGNGAQLYESTGAAVDTTGAGGVEAGSVYTAAGNRISRYSPKGEIKEVWGWNTIASGPDLPNQVSTLKVNATSGTYELEAQTAHGLANFTEGSKVITDIWTEVGAFHVGDPVKGGNYLSEGGGTGNITAGSATITSVTGLWPVGPTIRGRGIPPNTTITAYSSEAGTLTLSQPATETGTGVPLRAAPVITALGAGTLEVSVAAIGTTTSGRQRLSASETTAPIPYNASATEVKEALVALPAFGPADVSVTGTPGDYEITLEGSYAGSPVSLSSTESTLTGGAPSSSATVVTSEPTQPSRFERCRPANGDVCVSQEVGSPGGEEAGEFNEPQGVAVDQSTGDVYVLSGITPGSREHNLIEVFSADGSQVIARFGDAAASGETIEKGPEKLHRNPGGNKIGVDGTGNVYLTDSEIGPANTRVMCFHPETPGDYEHYVYCGRSQDVKLPAAANYFELLAVDDSGHAYVGTQQLLAEYILAEPTHPALCTFNTNGQAKSMTVNPLTGEVFYFNGTTADESIHRLKPCDPAVGKFKEAQAPVKVSPPTTRISGLAFNPTLTWGPERTPGVLYGTDFTWHRKETPPYKGLGYIFAPAEVLAPTIESESVSNTRTGSTILHAKINPRGHGTHYAFQYLSEARYEANDPSERFAGATEAPLGGGEIGGGSVGEALASVSGLAPDTAYRFRVVATSQCDPESGEPCVVEGEAFPFATYPLFPPGLPDHRAYELVSPPQKHGGEVIPADPEIGSCENCKPRAFGNTFPMQSTADGEALVYEGLPFSQTEGPVLYTSYLSRRTQTGWTTTGLDPTRQPSSGAGHVAVDASLQHGLLFESRNVGVESPTGSNLYLQGTSAPNGLTPLVTEAPPNRGTALSLAYGGHSADFSRLFFSANDTLTKATPFAPEPPDPGAAKNDLYEWHEGQLTVVNVAPGNATVMAGASFASTSPDTHAVSEDGTRVFFEDEAGHLYVREGGEATKQIDDPGHFLSATPDGSEVLLDDGCLYSLASESCVDLTEGRGGFKGLVGQSKSLSYLYFVDSAVLAENEGAGLDSEGNPQVAEAGKSNLYAWSGGETRFVAQLAANDNVSGTLNLSLNDWDPNPAHRTAEASPDGRFLAFASVAPLSGYDNVGPCVKAFDKELNEYVTVSAPCKEAFLYDSATGKLTCASCNPTGEAPLGNSTLRRLDGSPEQLPQPRYLTDEGRLYFDSQDSLVARDTNEGVEDVYEYSPQGAGAEGTCEREAGCVRLISAGTESTDSNLIAVDETGKNVFFDTRDELTLKDKDELIDVYDAREGGGIAAESEIARAECQGENCQAPVSPPNDPTPASSSFEGSGNVKEEPAAKKHSKKKHKHAKKHKKAKKHAKHARTAKRNHGGAK